MQSQTNTAHKLKIVFGGGWGRKEEEVVYMQWGWHREREDETLKSAFFPLISAAATLHQSCRAGTAQVLCVPGTRAPTFSETSCWFPLQALCPEMCLSPPPRSQHSSSPPAKCLAGLPRCWCPTRTAKSKTEKSERTQAWRIPSSSLWSLQGLAHNSSKPMIRIVLGYQWNLKSLQCDRNNSELRLRFLAAQGSSTHLTSCSARQLQQSETAQGQGGTDFKVKGMLSKCRHYIIKATYWGLSLLEYNAQEAQLWQCLFPLPKHWDRSG